MKTILLLGAAGAALLAVSPCAHAETPASPPAAKTSSAELNKLVAVIRPVGNSNVRGSVMFEKVDDGILIMAKIGGLTANAHHAIHIHEFGDLGSDDATSAGEHFNPGNHPHALPDDSDRHAGDLGNLQADGEGNATLTLVVNNITLDAGHRGILGRAVIVHSKADDGGQPAGNAGERIGAGVIGLSKDAKTPAPEPKVTKPAVPAPKEDAEGGEPQDKPSEPEQKETRPVQPDGDETADE